MRRTLGRMLLRGTLGLLLLGSHSALGGWLARLDPIDELVSGQRICVAAALVGLVLLRALVWFVLPAWWIGGTLADLLDTWSMQRASQREAR